MTRPWHCPPIRDRTSSPVQARDLAENQSGGHHFGALAAAQAGQHDPEVGEVAARQPEFVVDIADDMHCGPHGRNGPQVRLEHLARQVRRQPDPNDRLHRAARRLGLRRDRDRDRPYDATPGYRRRNTPFSMIMLGTTRAGDAYPYSEYDRMFRKAGFTINELRRGPGPQSFIISNK